MFRGGCSGTAVLVRPVVRSALSPLRSQYPEARRNEPGCCATGMYPVGNYAYQIDFSDGHKTGIYSLELLRELGEES